MKKIILLLSLKAFMAYSQVGIGTTNLDPSSVLDIQATSKGLLIPRINLTTNPVLTQSSEITFSLEYGYFGLFRRILLF